jgi:acetyltransferase-like isoleucine patch superfamily enzyme
MPNIYQNLRHRISRRWKLFLLARSGPSGFGRIASRMLVANIPPYHKRASLAGLSRRGFIAPGASVNHPELILGAYVYVGDNVIIAHTKDGGPIELQDRVHLYGDGFLDTGVGGKITIGEGTHIQPGCHIHSYLSEIQIGCRVEIAPRCGFYSYDHGMEPGIPIMDQPLKSKGPIVIGDGAWIGYGATVLQGVTVGEGAVIAAGAVVLRDIPANAIAAGVPARVVGHRTASGEIPHEGKITPISRTGTNRNQETIRKIKP